MGKGQLEGFPKEIIAAMLKEQVKQGNKEDITVFESYKSAAKGDKGFNWETTKEGMNFWDKILNARNFDHFFTNKKIKKESSKFKLNELI